VSENQGAAIAIGVAVIVLFGALITLCVLGARTRKKKQDTANLVLEELQAQMVKGERDRGFVKPASHDSFISEDEEEEALSVESDSY